MNQVSWCSFFIVLLFDSLILKSLIKKRVMISSEKKKSRSHGSRVAVSTSSMDCLSIKTSFSLLPLLSSLIYLVRWTKCINRKSEDGVIPGILEAAAIWTRERQDSFKENHPTHKSAKSKRSRKVSQKWERCQERKNNERMRQSFLTVSKKTILTEGGLCLFSSWTTSVERARQGREKSKSESKRSCSSFLIKSTSSISCRIKRWYFPFVGEKERQWERRTFVQYRQQ
jgi:hypothetical protein